VKPWWYCAGKVWGSPVSNRFGSNTWPPGGALEPISLTGAAVENVVPTPLSCLRQRWLSGPRYHSVIIWVVMITYGIQYSPWFEVNRAKVPADYVIASNSKIFAARLLRARQLNVRYSSTSDFKKIPKLPSDNWPPQPLKMSTKYAELEARIAEACSKLGESWKTKYCWCRTWVWGSGKLSAGSLEWKANSKPQGSREQETHQGRRTCCLHVSEPSRYDWNLCPASYGYQLCQWYS